MLRSRISIPLAGRAIAHCVGPPIRLTIASPASYSTFSP
jgi:hypothetical protein